MVRRQRSTPATGAALCPGHRPPHDGLNCVAPVQVYLDLLHLPERADEAARHLRAHQLQHHAGAR